MQAVVQEGTASSVSKLGRPVAGKTGTTSHNRSAWFAGFTPQYATVVAMYRMGKHGEQLSLVPWADAGGEVTGGTLPARVWTEYMSSVLQGVPVADFPAPSYGGQTVNPLPASPAAAPAPSPSTLKPQPSRPAPTPSSPQPSPSGPVPSPSGTPGPTPSERPFPTPPGRPRPTFPPVPSPST
jgi:membrane peptidoglycan carboxypeptidase